MRWLERLVDWLVKHNVVVPERLFDWAMRRKTERKGWTW